MLGKKQSIRNETEWRSVMEDIEEIVPKSELNALIADTVADVKAVCDEKKAAYAWSGGKDSIVLGEICRKAGINQAVLVVCDLEYPDFLSWIETHKPDNLEIINTGQNLEWLAKHPQMLFPKDSATSSRWFQIVQHRGQEKYFKEHSLDMLILGRRKADGNYVGKGSNIYTNARGITRYSPLASWRHEDILAYIHYYAPELPPIYNWKNGYLCGTHPWPARQHMESETQGWGEIYEIDKSIVEKAAEFFSSAREFLEAVK